METPFDRDPLEPPPARKTPEGMIIDELKGLRADIQALTQAILARPQPAPKKAKKAKAV